MRAFPPTTRNDARQSVLDEILDAINPTRRKRANPRVIKRKMSNWPVKRTRHRNPEAPTPTNIQIL